MKAHQLFLLTFWLHHVYLALGAFWEIDFSPLKGYYNSFNIIPSPYYYKSDVKNIYKALNNENWDEIKVIEILGRLESDDRQLLIREYQRFYDTHLVNNLRDKLTGKLEEVVVAIMSPLEKFFAQEINDAINGGSDESALIDTLCLFDATMLDEVKTVYKTLYNNDMAYKMKINTVGSFGKLMVSCIHNMRYKGASTENYISKMTDGFTDDDFINFFSQSSFEELHDIGTKHEHMYGKKIEDIIEEKFYGDFRRALMAISNYTLSEELYFVMRFHESLERPRVDHRSLIRLILMKKKVHYRRIRDSYKKQYNQDIDEVLSKKLPPGSYRKLIQALFIRM